MLIYLDTCALQRPLDDRTQIRIKLEAEAILCVLGFIEVGSAGLVSSDALKYETEKCPNLAKRQHVNSILDQASVYVTLDDKIKARSKNLVVNGFKQWDAFQLASAEAAKADFFLYMR